MTSERKMIPVRLPEGMHRDLRLLALLTGQSANAIITGLVGDYLSGPGRVAIEQAMTGRAVATYGEALRRLARQ